MTKAEIVAEIASKTGIEKGAVQNVVENFMEVVKNAMSKPKNYLARRNEILWFRQAGYPFRDEVCGA